MRVESAVAGCPQWHGGSAVLEGFLYDWPSGLGPWRFFFDHIAYKNVAFLEEKEIIVSFQDN